MLKTIGFIGFGEVGYIFSKAIQEAGAETIVYDVLFDDVNKAEEKKQLAKEANIKIGTLNDVLKSSAIVISTVTTQVANKVARTCALMLHPEQIYVDMNSTSPNKKIEIGKIIEDSKADFVEGAILDAVGTAGAKTRILVGGTKGKEIAKVLNDYGLNVTFYSSEIGKASKFKMLRSIFTKGLEAILLELLVTGKRAGIEKDLWEDISSLMKSKSFDDIAKNWIVTHAIANERRYYEMLQVIETMDELGIKPIMTEATASYFKRSVDIGISKVFTTKPKVDELVGFIESNLKQN